MERFEKAGPRKGWRRSYVVTIGASRSRATEAFWVCGWKTTVPAEDELKTSCFLLVYPWAFQHDRYISTAGCCGMSLEHRELTLDGERAMAYSETAAEAAAAGDAPPPSFQ